VIEAYVNVDATGQEPQIEEVVADKGYHAAATLAECEACSLRTYIPEPKRPHESRWTGKPADFERCVSNNRRRLRRAKSKKPERWRSELCERTFAHICDTGGMRRSWLRGLEDVSKRYTIAAAAHNLGRIPRTLFGVGKPRALQGEGATSPLTQLVIARLLAILSALVSPPTRETPARMPRAC
jgi:transposase